MGLVEAVVGELVEQVPDLLGLGLADAVGLGAVEKERLLCVHLGLDLLAHRPAQRVRAAQRVTRHPAGDLHHLLLIDDDALGLVEERVDGRMKQFAGFPAVLDVAELGDVLHRAGAVERDQRDDVLDAGGLELAQGVAHARAFHLEDRDGGGGGIERVGRGIVERDRADVDVDAARRQQVEGVADDRERLQPEEVELHEARLPRPISC